MQAIFATIEFKMAPITGIKNLLARGLKIEKLADKEPELRRYWDKIVKVDKLQLNTDRSPIAG